MSSKGKKTPSRTPRSSPKAKTPTIMSIGETISDTLAAAKEALPAGGISTLGLKPEDIQVVIDFPNILRGILIIGAVIAYVLCLVLFLVGHTGSKNKVDAAFPGKINDYFFSPWFVVILLTASIAGFMYILFAINSFSFFFVVAAFAYLFSLVMLFVKLYYDVALYSSAVQIYSFIIFVDVFIFGMVVTQATNNFIFSLFALVPTLVFIGFCLYNGGILNG
jgi:hypothetical protein